MTDEIKGDKKEGVSILTHPLAWWLLVVLNEKNNSLSLPLLMSIGEEIIGETESIYALSVFFISVLL